MRRLVLIAALACVPAAISQEQQQGKQEEGGPAASDGPAILHPKAGIETRLGNIVVQLDGEKAPISTVNFLRYVESGHYEGTIFHRVIPTFMVQGGGHLPSMEERKPSRPPIFNEWRNGLKNERGTIAMARTNQPNSATAQFFINVVDNKMLDQPRPPDPRRGAAYAVFGKVVEGMDVVDKIRDTETVDHPDYPGSDAVTPKEPIIITKAEVLGDATADKVAEAIEKHEQALLEQQVKKAEEEAGAKVQKTDSGLMYVVMEEGDGPSPAPSNTVKVHYTGWLVNGREFDSSRDGDPAQFQLSGVIKGWTEGVGMMKVGGKRRLFLPPDLGYGERGSATSIPPDAWLVFDVELLGIQ